VSTTTRLRTRDRVLEVTVLAEGDAVRATVDGRPLEARRLPAPSPPYAAGGAVVHEIALAVDGRTLHAVVATSRERVLVSLGGRTYVFAAGEDGAVAGAGGGGTGKITAPMPGKVIAILVAPGDRVEHGQGVLVIEAMKMETTLAADVDGEVARVAASVGETVDGGALLVEITPA
jgi:3-methylcrotonyl-CoA carboxylase alpha subunit